MSERGTYAKGRARRQEILDTALRVLAERGYRATSLRGIGRELDMQPAHILYYFASKEELLEEVIRAWDRDSPAERARSTSDGVDDFLTDWVDIVRHNMTVPGLVHLYTAFAAEAADENHPSRAFFRRRFDDLRARLAAAIRRDQADALVAPDVDAERSAVNLIALSDGLQLQWLIDPTIDMAGELEAAIARIRPQAPRR